MADSHTDKITASPADEMSEQTAPRTTLDKSVDASPADKGSLSVFSFDSQLEADYQSLHAAHSALLQRVQSEGYADDANGDEAIRLRNDVKQLRKELDQVTEERDELRIAVRDLRVRVEESRRAVMRLQAVGSSGQRDHLPPSASSAGTALNDSNSNGSLSAAVEGGMSRSPSLLSKADKRASVGPGALPSWNPREMGGPTNGLGIFSQASTSQGEDADAKRAKRTSVAFGPYASNTGTIGRRATHRRVPSGESEVGASSSVTDANTSVASTAPSAAVTGGLRGLRLGGGANAAPPSVQQPTSASSKRSSFIGTSIFRSPQLASSAETNGEESPQQQSTLGSLLMPMRSIRRSSNSSSVSGNSGGRPMNRDENESLLGAPRSTSRLSNASASTSHHSNTSPDERREETTLGDAGGEYIAKLDHSASRLQRSPTTEMQNPQRGSFASSVPAHVQRALAESRERLADRETQLHSLRKEMLAMRLELEESKNARAASEACLKALREFANGGGDNPDGDAAGLRGVKLPPLPTDEVDDEEEEESKEKPSLMPSQSPPQLDASSGPTGGWRSLSRQFGSFSRRASSAVQPNPTALPPGSAAYSAQAPAISPGLSATRNEAMPPPGIGGMPLLGKPRSPSVSTTALPGGNGQNHDSNGLTSSPRILSPRLAQPDIEMGNNAHTKSARRSSVMLGGMPARYRGSSTSSGSSATAGPPSATNRRFSSSVDNVPSSPASRARKAMEATNSIDEDNGFAPPAF